MPISKARLRISDYNRQRKDHLKQKERRIRMISLSLTSMVDMFAILVLYLLTSTSTVTQWLQMSHVVSLPQGKFGQVPTKAGTLEVTKETLYADDKPLVSIKEILNGSALITPLKTWLKLRKASGGFINLVGDRSIPFGAVQRIVATCQESGYNNVNLAIQPTN